MATSAHAAARNRHAEAIYPLTQSTLYCATAPKSNTAKGVLHCREAVRRNPGAKVPMYLRNAPTELMKDLGYHEGYRYDHDEPDHYSGQQCLPMNWSGPRFTHRAASATNAKSPSAWPGGGASAVRRANLEPDHSSEPDET